LEAHLSFADYTTFRTMRHFSLKKSGYDIRVAVHRRRARAAARDLGAKMIEGLSVQGGPEGVRMRQVAPPVRIMALAAAREPARARSDLYRSFALLMAAVAMLVIVVAFLVLRTGAAPSASNVAAARWLVGALGFLIAVLSFVSGRLFLRRSAELPARRIRIDERGVFFEGPETRHAVE